MVANVSLWPLKDPIALKPIASGIWKIAAKINRDDAITATASSLEYILIRNSLKIIIRHRVNIAKNKEMRIEIFDA